MKHNSLKQNLSFSSTHLSGNPSHKNDAAPFSTRRVWVKRPNGTPTTLSIHANEIVDDLKVLIISKYPTTLGRNFDPADLTIKIDCFSKSFPINRALKNHLSPQPKKDVSPVSPVPITVSGNTSLLNSSPSLEAEPTQSRCVVLEPDQLVWKVLDQYFPVGMQMTEAFIIETPELKHIVSSVKALNSVSPSTSNNDNANTTTLSDMSNQRHHSTSSMTDTNVLQNYPGSLTDTMMANGQAYLYSNSVNKDKPLSPGMRKSPSFPYHRRIQSTSSQSSTSSSAVLLLPKNFTLTNSEDKKRLSMTESSNKGSNNITNLKDTKAEGVDPTLTEPYSSFNPVDDRPLKQLTPIEKEYYLKSLSLPASLQNTVDTPGSDVTDPSIGTNSSLTSETEIGKERKPPALRPATIRPPDKESTKQKVLPSINVLVVEDNTINQAILAAFLRKHKIRYNIAKNGQEAIEKWREGGYHLVLMDIQLPVMSGIQATKEIRRLEKMNKIGVFSHPEVSSIKKIDDTDKLNLTTFRSPVIIVALTASTSSADRKEALTAGCNDYLTKPVNLVWLQNKITEWGCMQALIDFDGWQIGEKNREKLLGSALLNGRKKSIQRKSRVVSQEEPQKSSAS